jgi:hypothetical protein
VSRRRLAPGKRRFDVAGTFEVLCQNIARADAMVCATERQLERFTWGGENDDGDESDGYDGDDRRFEHLAYLLEAAREAVRAAVYGSGQVAAELAKWTGAAHGGR